MPVRFVDDYENEISAPRGKLFGRERSIHQVLGGGKGIVKSYIYIYI